MEERKGAPKRSPGSEQKRKNPMGILALCLCLGAVLLLAILGGILLGGLRGGSPDDTQLRNFMTGTLVAAAMGAAALLCALTGLFLPRRKRAGSVTALLLSLVVGGGAALVFGSYSYAMGGLETDESFREIPTENLGVVTPQEDGIIHRETLKPQGSVDLEALEDMTGIREIHRYIVANEDMPPEALAYMWGDPPARDSYLREGFERVDNLVLFGLDKLGSSDCIIIASVDHVHHKVKLISISRDTYALLPRWNAYSRITYAYGWGNVETAMQAVNANFSLNLTDYISVDFQQLKDIVDYMGGVEVNLDWAEVQYLANSGHWNVQYGPCVLDGDAALCYARIRSSSNSDNEFQRTGRQREVVIGLMEKLRTMNITDYPKLVRTCLGLCSTSLESEKLVQMCLRAVMGGYEVEQYLIPQDGVEYWGGQIDGTGYCVYDMGRASDRIYRLIYEDLYVSGYEE